MRKLLPGFPRFLLLYPRERAQVTVHHHLNTHSQRGPNQVRLWNLLVFIFQVSGNWTNHQLTAVLGEDLPGNNTALRRNAAVPIYRGDNGE